jgi:hypothetical protein
MLNINELLMCHQLVVMSRPYPLAHNQGKGMEKFRQECNLGVTFALSGPGNVRE